MGFKAVIFDLFGTLTKNPSLKENNRIIEHMATALSAPSEDFTRLWRNTFDHRCSGAFPTIEANIEDICRRLNTPISNNQITLATRLRADMVKQEMSPRRDTIKALSYLKTHGYKTGLISDCSPPVPDIWPDTPYAPLIDVAVFSCVVGVKKPDARIYWLATEQLGVEPRDCLYIGDGSSQELTGATAVGMQAVLIREPDEESAGVFRVDAETERWDGPVISSLHEILNLVR